jgi:hypothetical protein
MWIDATGTYVATRCQSYICLILNRIVQRPQNWSRTLVIFVSTIIHSGGMHRGNVHNTIMSSVMSFKRTLDGQRCRSVRTAAGWSSRTARSDNTDAIADKLMLACKKFQFLPRKNSCAGLSIVAVPPGPFSRDIRSVGSS